MNKSILVIDTPKNCSECPLFFGAYTDMVCKANNRTINYPYPDNKVQDWCPLKEVPTKKKDSLLNNAYVKGTVDGYNACIEEIIK